MSYQVLARKWRPQRFDDVVGQPAVTRTLRNAITSGRVAQAFVFAGPRGCGKTTTARILARALNCVKGPSPDPCGECDACTEIAQGRDMDVLEIDAASHSGIDNIREVVIAGLAIAPVRDRCKVFIIDEVHQLSGPSFNALLKSIEEPPVHVVFMMATTELHKIPDTILSRSQVYEFRTIPTRAIADHLRTIADAEKIEVSEVALALIARAAEGSMRDAQSALDQVIAFAGQSISVDDVSTVLGLVGRDLLVEVIEAVIEEDGPRAFALADRATQAGHDLRLVCRELSRVVRDMMLISVDPARAGDGELAEGERDRLAQLAQRFSREDLMRAFDLLAKAETDIRTASHPRYHFEMVLLRWMHLRKLVPLAELMERLAGGRGDQPPVPNRTGLAPSQRSQALVVPPATPATKPVAAGAKPTPPPAPVASSGLKDALLEAIRSARPLLHDVVTKAQRIDVSDNRVVFTFLRAGAQRDQFRRDQFEQNRPWLESAAERIAGGKIQVVAVQSDAPDPAAGVATPLNDEAKPGGDVAKRDLKAEAMSSSAVQAMLDVFPAEIRDVEEM